MMVTQGALQRNRDFVRLGLRAAPLGASRSNDAHLKPKVSRV